MIGTTIAHYTITEKIGQGGMGEVYRATDTKLNRDVALKVLPEAFAQDQQRMARFAREAQVLASLNHPNIATIHGLEESDGKQALVLELVEGEDLAERIKRGAIPLEESLKIALQIAEALEAAHEKGVIHRDLKPANLKITSEGVVKVLDFGLAKAMEEVVPEDISQSPTISQLATKAGIILGTAAYMSPEQARGKPVDRRTDIWAFGVVLYEMLTGKMAFQGEDISLTLAAVMTKEPVWEALPGKLPVPISSLLKRCLDRDQSHRLRDIGEARIVVQDYQADPSSYEIDPTVVPPLPYGQKQLVPWVLLAATMAALLILLFVLWPTSTMPGRLARFPIPLPSDQPLTGPGRHQVAFSPDGQHLVYSANQQLYLRPIGQLEAIPIRGTAEGIGRSPFFSPDGQWVGFWAGALRKVAITGGAPVTLCEAGNLFGASWGEDDRIVFGLGPEGIFQVSANGGEKELLISVDSEKNEQAHGPQILPGGEAVLFTLRSGSSWDDAQIVVQSLESEDRKVLVNGGTDARYVPTGHLVYMQRGTLLAVPFDVARLEVTGSRVPILEGVRQATGTTGAAQFTFSDHGSLAYIPGGIGANRTLVWVNRDGQEEPLTAEPRAYDFPRISPRGGHLSVVTRDRERPNVWTFDLRRNTLARLTFDTAVDLYPIWTPDGERIVFGSTRDGVVPNLYSKAADGTGQAKRLADSPYYQVPYSFSPDGKNLVFGELVPETGLDLQLLSMEEEYSVQPLLETGSGERHGEISPDGKWMAYNSDESGTYQVYVRPFPNVDDGRWQISSRGGRSPAWNPQGSELFYRTGQEMMVVLYEAETTFIPESPEVLFSGTYSTGSHRNYDLHPAGQRFLMIKESGAAGDVRQQLILVQNWFEELKRLVPTDN